MKGIICFYSGSGNTKHACTYLASKITTCQLELVDITKDATPDLEECDVVGFATFTDAWAPPPLMRAFIQGIPNQDGIPAFVFNTFGFISGKTLKRLDELATAQGFTVIGGHALHMPENYPPMIVSGNGNEDHPNESEMASFDRFIAELDLRLWQVKDDGSCPHHHPDIGLLNTLLPPFPRSLGFTSIGKKVADEGRCKECGVCARICPYGAIDLDPTPVFDENLCQSCWACYNHCPEGAILAGRFTGDGRYPRPNEHVRRVLKS